MSTVKMKGLDALKRRLAALPAQVKGPVEAQFAKEVSNLTEIMKAHAPTSDLEGHPGELRDSIHAEAGKAELSARLVADAKDAEGHVYPAHVEYGHRARDGRHVGAQPFWWPTWRSQRKRIRRRMRAAGLKAVKAAFPAETTGGE